jgi:hypothetical protein
MDITGIGSVLDFGSKIIDRIWPDPTQRDAAKLELFKAQQEGAFKEMDQAFELAKSQIDTNTAEAGNPNTFVSGWRPFIGWTCGSAFAYKFVLAPVLIFGLEIVGKHVVLPIVDVTELMPVLLGMLGLGAMRTYEKVKGVA